MSTSPKTVDGIFVTRPGLSLNVVPYEGAQAEFFGLEGHMTIKELTMTVSGPVVKEHDEMLLVDNEDDTATWYDKALLWGRVDTPRGIVTFNCHRTAAVRNVKLK